MAQNRRAIVPAGQQEAGKALERFHLAFLEVATAQLPLPQFALKGGANLRFFFKSLRRSVDMDFNYLGAPERSWAFAERVDGVFRSNALGALLRARDLSFFDLRKPKQTDTTRRWKFNLRAPGVETVPSKIEFSARGAGHDDGDYELASVDPELARRLQARPVKLNHYLPVAAIAQKIGALRLRSETQARDIFDLDHLFRSYPEALAVVRVSLDELRAARDHALALTYEDYSSTVVPYLEEAVLELYGSEDAWLEMQVRVVERLQWKESQL